MLETGSKHCGCITMKVFQQRGMKTTSLWKHWHWNMNCVELTIKQVKQQKLESNICSFWALKMILLFSSSLICRFFLNYWSRFHVFDSAACIQTTFNISELLQLSLLCPVQLWGQWRWRYLTADDPGEVGLFWGVDQELGLVGSLSLILSTDLQGQSVIVSDVNLITVAVIKNDSGNRK